MGRGRRREGAVQSMYPLHTMYGLRCQITVHQRSTDPSLINGRLSCLKLRVYDKKCCLGHENCFDEEILFFITNA